MTHLEKPTPYARAFFSIFVAALGCACCDAPQAPTETTEGLSVSAAALPSTRCVDPTESFVRSCLGASGIPECMGKTPTCCVVGGTAEDGTPLCFRDPREVRAHRPNLADIREESPALAGILETSRLDRPLDATQLAVFNSESQRLMEDQLMTLDALEREDRSAFGFNLQDCDAGCDLVYDVCGIVLGPGGRCFTIGYGCYRSCEAAYRASEDSLP